MDLPEARQAIADRIDAMDSQIRAHAYVPDAPKAPCAVVGLADTQYDTVYGSEAFRVNFTVSLLAGSISDRAAQQQLDVWLSPVGDESIKAALETDGLATVTDFRNYGAVSVDTQRFIGVDLIVSMWIDPQPEPIDFFEEPAPPGPGDD